MVFEVMSFRCPITVYSIMGTNPNRLISGLLENLEQTSSFPPVFIKALNY